jgi:sRNA-binding protein
MNEIRKVNNTNTNKIYKPKLNQEELEQKHKAVELHKQKKEQAIALYNQYFSYFSKLYPNCFSNTPKPLAIGIDKAIIVEEAKKSDEEQITLKALRRFLGKYTRSVAYKEAMQSGSSRINLQGKEVDKVTPEHAEIARISLEEWQNKQAIRQNNKRLPEKQREKVTNLS